jgi:hypothetical protein
LSRWYLASGNRHHVPSLVKNQKGVDFLNFIEHYPITVVELFMLVIVTDSSTGAAPGIKQGGFWRDDSLPVERR